MLLLLCFCCVAHFYVRNAIQQISHVLLQIISPATLNPKQKQDRIKYHGHNVLKRKWHYIFCAIHLKHFICRILQIETTAVIKMLVKAVPIIVHQERLHNKTTQNAPTLKTEITLNIIKVIPVVLQTRDAKAHLVAA